MATITYTYGPTPADPTGENLLRSSAAPRLADYATTFRVIDVTVPDGSGGTRELSAAEFEDYLRAWRELFPGCAATTGSPLTSPPPTAARSD